MWTGVILQSTQHIRVLGYRSHTHLMLCADGSLCVAKLLDQSQHRRLVSGFIATRLARHLGLPTPEEVLVEIPAFLLRDVQELRGVQEPPRIAAFGANNATNLYPATYYAGGVDRKQLVDILPDSYLASLANLESFLHFLALDQWCSHLGAPRAVFYRSSPNSAYSAEFVNRTPSFGGEALSFQDHPRNGVYVGGRTVYRHVRGWESFDPFLSNLILTKPDTLWQLTRDLPFGWSEEYASYLDALVEGLLRRRSMIRQLIAKSRDHIPDLFPQWTRRAFMPTQGSWFESPQALGAGESCPIKNSV